jgi:radical SAM superfamily enzyme YgiQ (UPF0313 family)
MANLGYHYIYRKLRETGLAAERFFLGPIPHRSVDGDILLERFGIVMAGLSYEGDVPAFMRWLLGTGIDPSRASRDCGSEPLIGAGGAMTYINPLALAGVCDFIVLGDGLPVLDHVALALRRGGTRRKILDGLAEHPSILVPSVHLDDGGTFSLEVAKQEDISKDYGHGNWIAPKSAFGDALLVELQRGCARNCRYCTLPTCFGPFRQRPLQQVMRDIETAAGKAAFGRVGLVTPEASDYRGLNALLDFIGDLDKGVSFASLRADGLSRGMLKSLSSGGWRSVTLAPESGDDALRVSCGKHFTNDNLIDVLYMAKEEGIINAKLYFMIGLPGENSSHVLAIEELCGRIRKETGLRLTAAVSPFVPKPGTAWGGLDFEGEAPLKAKFAILSKAMRGLSGTSLQKGSVKEAAIEHALSWASSRVSGLTAELVKASGPSGQNPLRQITGEADKRETREELQRLGLFQESADFIPNKFSLFKK